MSRFPGRSLKSLCAEMFVTLEDPLYFRWLIASSALIAMASPLLPLHRLPLFGALWVPAVPAAFCGSLYVYRSRFWIGGICSSDPSALASRPSCHVP